MRKCFAIVLYKAAEPYLKDLVASLKGQTYKDFEILILNDDYSAEYLDDKLKRLDLEDYRLVSVQEKMSPAMLRVELLQVAKAGGYDFCIIGDADDTFLDNRVEKLVEAAKADKEAVFFYNDLVNEDKDILFANLPENTKDVSLIDSNFLGMSITAINLNKLTDDWIETLREGETHIFDWYLFERMMLDVGYGSYVPDTGTVYRQHAGNIAGNQKDDFSLVYLEREKAVKLEHYKLMAKRYPRYQELADKLQKINVSEIKPKRGGFWWSKISVTDEGEINAI